MWQCLQEAQEHTKRVAEEQRALQQETDRLQGELEGKSGKLEAKRAKKRKWKALHTEQAAESMRMGDLLRDKQFAIEKAVLRFAAADARIKAGEMFQDGQKQVAGGDVTDNGAVLRQLEQALDQKRLERLELQDTLHNAKTVRPC